MVIWKKPKTVFKVFLCTFIIDKIKVSANSTCFQVSSTLSLTSKSDWTPDNIRTEKIISAPIWATFFILFIFISFHFIYFISFYLFICLFICLFIFFFFRFQLCWMLDIVPICNLCDIKENQLGKTNDANVRK